MCCCCCHDPDYSRLCRLINNDSLLLSYTEPQPISLTKEGEKNLLIILSQVSREILSWENIQDCTSQLEIVGNSASGGKCSHGLKSCCEDNHNCLASIVTVLVTLFTVESQYVQHSTGNALLIISSFLAKSGTKWVGFLHLLCLCLEAALSNVISSQPLSLKAGSIDSDSDTLSFILAVRQRLANANWRTTCCLIQVLRNILKHMKQDYDNSLMERYIHSVSNCLSNIPWDSVSDINGDQASEARTSSITNILLHGKIGSPESRFLFLGALLQLLCSLTEQIGSMETGGDSLDKHPHLDIIIGLVPKLLCWCFYKQGDYNHAFTSQYLKHKMLVLMTRLNFQSRWECSTLVLWLQLLRKYFQDLLNQPFFESPAGLDDSLEGSPFQADVVYGDKICTPHLQRQAIFLFLKCSFSLISVGKEADIMCSCTKSSLSRELQYDQQCCNKKRGLSELSEWLQRHVPLETFVDNEIYLEKCRSFALSFLQLYMDEDDFLFEVLLQLTLPPPAKRVELKEKKVFEEVQGDMLFHLSNVFNPVHLFHLFLAELHYDHLVLLDYLISKDTGIHCVQYLLRCLRIVSSSWCMFVEYSVHEVETSQLACKKRKFSEDSLDSNGKIQPSPVSVKGDVDLGLLDRESKKNHKSGSMLNNTRHTTFENAKECLLSLKRSVENLHHKNLFPYNPSALLRSFTRFLELCHQQEKV